MRRLGGELDLDAIAITTPDSVGEAAPRLARFLDQGRHGDMTWMADRQAERSNPRALWSEARSVIMVGQSYAPESDPLAVLQKRDRAGISVYAQGRDYHDVLKKRIRELAKCFSERSGADVKIFVDTAPLLEKPLAAAAGIGWQGKHTNLVSRTHGSWLFLGAILTTAELSPGSAETDHCGSCRRCLDVCPTAAFPAPYQLDARRCLAYLTIEYKGHIPSEFRVPLGNRVFGCDDCLAVCPWNRFAAATRETRYQARAETDNPPIGDLLALDDDMFRARFSGTPIKRTGRDRIVRNALIAAGNSGMSNYVPAIEALLDDNATIVRAMAVWALGRLGNHHQIASAARLRVPNEHDPAVVAEWQAILTEQA